MSKRELWEIVRADKLKVGDVMRQSVKEWPYENALCFTMCERPPYPQHVVEKIGKRRKPLKCTNCLRKIQQIGGGA